MGPAHERRGEQRSTPGVRSHRVERPRRAILPGRAVGGVHVERDGRTEVYVQSFPAGERKWQISNGGGSKPVWRSDGRELYCLSPDGHMMAASLKPEPAFLAAEPKPLFAVAASFLGFGAQFAVDEAGETFSVNSTASARRDAVTVVLNWRPDVN